MPFERRELRMIERLELMKIYPQLVQKLTAGESARAVARWAMSSGVEGAPGHWGSEYWLKASLGATAPSDRGQRQAAN